jgi:hypothetical protein
MGRPRQELPSRREMRRHGEVMNDISGDKDDRRDDPDPRPDEQQGRDQWIEQGQARLVSRAGRMKAAIVPRQAMLDHQASVVEPGAEQAGSPNAAND